MNVNLGNTFDKFITDLLETGLYQSQSEVVREALRLLKEREDLKALQLAGLRAEIAVGSHQADRGEFVEGRQAFDKIRQRSAAMKRAIRTAPPPGSAGRTSPRSSASPMTCFRCRARTRDRR